MAPLKLLLLIAAAICFLLSVLSVGGRRNLVALGLLFWVLVPLLDAANLT